MALKYECPVPPVEGADMKHMIRIDIPAVGSGGNPFVPIVDPTIPQNSFKIERLVRKTHHDETRHGDYFKTMICAVEWRNNWIKYCLLLLFG